MIITNPHDKFFRETFSRLDVVQNFIEETFPEDLREAIDLNSLSLSNASFTDETLAQHIADLVYQAEYQGQEILITLLYEHKSYIDPFPHWQLLRYMTNIWYEEQKQSKKHSLVIPIIIYHGSTVWQQASLRSYFKDSAENLQRFLPEFDYLLYSLNDFTDQQIANFKNIFLSTATMILKHSRDSKEQFLQIESFIVEHLKTLIQLNQQEYIHAIVVYLENTTDLTINEIILIFTKKLPQIADIVMTPIEQALQIGTENAMIQAIKALLKKGFDVSFIADTFDMPVPRIEELIKQDQPREPWKL